MSPNSASGWLRLGRFLQSLQNKRHSPTASDSCRTSEFNLHSVTCRESSATPQPVTTLTRKEASRTSNRQRVTERSRVPNVHFRNRAYFTPPKPIVYSKSFKIHFEVLHQASVKKINPPLLLLYTNQKSNFLNILKKEGNSFSSLYAYCRPGSIPGSVSLFTSLQRPDRLCRPPTLLSNGYRELFVRG
jgi:hypothetical protein